MFGYIRPCSTHLDESSQNCFKAYYCGLCRLLGSTYGYRCRAFLNYECVFLAVLLDSMEGEAIIRPGRCPLPPFNKKDFASCRALDYAAAINVILAYYKLEDNWHDDASAAAWAGLKIYHRAAAKASRNYPQSAGDIAIWMKEFSRQEAGAEADASTLAHLCGKVLQAVFENGFDPGPYGQALGWAGYHAGRWVYLVDAFDDLEQDWKKSKFNPFLIGSSCRNQADLDRLKEETAATLSPALYSSLEEISKTLFLIQAPRNRELLENLVNRGMYGRTMAILQGRHEKPRFWRRPGRAKHAPSTPAVPVIIPASEVRK